MKNILLTLMSLFLLSCTNLEEPASLNLKLSKKNVASGENVHVTYDKNPELSKVRAALISGNGRAIEVYNFQDPVGVFSIRRIFSNLDKLNYSENNRIEFLAFDKNNQIMSVESIDINLLPSIVVKSLCHTEMCDVVSGNVIGKLSQKLKIEVFGLQAIKFRYIVNHRKEPKEYTRSFDSPVDNDYLENIVFDEPNENESFYLTSIFIIATDKEGNEILNAIPVKVVRPIEVRYDGKYKLAQTFEPVPVSGCITGTLDNRIEYNETKSETRENSIEVAIDKNWSNSVGLSVSQDLTEGIQVSETIGNSISKTSEQSESNENGWERSNTHGETSEFNWSTSNGESWEYNNSSSTGNSQTNETQNEVNGSVTVGVEGEGSLPFLGKIGGNVSTTGGVRRGWNNSNTETNEQTQGYSISGNSEKGQSFGSVQSDEQTTSISGAYVVGKSYGSGIENSQEQSNTRVWDMTNSTSKENVISLGNSESISKTQVDSQTTTTSLNFSTFLPRGRKGIFYRQTSRWAREINVITYDQNGIPKLAGKMIANEWNWAVSMAIGETCQEISDPKMEEVECFIEPCF